MTHTRGTSNTNDRGSAEARRRRKTWLFEVWAADWDVVTLKEYNELRRALEAEVDLPWGGEVNYGGGDMFEGVWVKVFRGLGRPAVRCFRCGRVCTWETVESDRIKPGAEGGRYTKGNIRPVCECCNKKLSGEWVKRQNAKRKARNQRRRDLRRKCGVCGAVPAAGNAAVTVGGVTTWLCHPDEGVSCYDGSMA